jgi:hypothetical protein
MPEINLSDSRKRDALVKDVGTRVRERLRSVGPEGEFPSTHRLLKSTVDHDLDALQAQFGEPEAIAQALVSSDPVVDLERFGQSLWFLFWLFINPQEKPVYQMQQNELVFSPFGEILARRPLQRAEANTNAPIPLQ